MTDQELLQAISQIMDQKLTPIREELAEIRRDIEKLKENLDETRDCVSMLINWSDNIFEHEFKLRIVK